MLRSVLVVTSALSAGVIVSCARGAPEAEVVRADPVKSSEDAAPIAPAPVMPAPSSSPTVEETVAEPPKPTKPLSKAECNKLWDHAQATDEAAFSAADKKCSADTDCETVQVRACLADCNSSAIAKSASAAYAKARAKTEATDCKAWFDGSCVTKTPMPVPSCPMYVPTCASGKCASRHGP